MKINELKDSWELIAQAEPYYGVLTNERNKSINIDLKKFFNSGKIKIRKVLSRLETIDRKFQYNICLDFGCGVGRLSQALCDKFDKVIGVDISQSMIELANRHNQHTYNCNYLLNETNNLDQFESNSFDMIISLLTLQHMKPELSFSYIDEFARTLKCGGVMVIQLPTEAPLARNIIQFLLPSRLMKYFKHLKSINGGIMEMYTTSKNVIINNISNNLEILHIEDEIDNKGWTYSTFYILKK